MVYLGEIWEFVGGSLLASLALVVIGVVEFLAVLWVISRLVGYLNMTPDAGWMVVGSALIVAASLLASKREY